MQAVSSLAELEDMPEQKKAFVHDPESYSTRVSLPLLFDLPSETVSHGIFLKSPGKKADAASEHKIVLLATKVVREVEIPDEEIHPVPGTLHKTRFSLFFEGIKFTDDPTLPNLVLVLNPGRLIQYAEKIIEKRKKQHDKNANRR